MVSLRKDLSPTLEPPCPPNKVSPPLRKYCHVGNGQVLWLMCAFVLFCFILINRAPTFTIRSLWSGLLVYFQRHVFGRAERVMAAPWPMGNILSLTNYPAMASLLLSLSIPFRKI